MSTLTLIQAEALAERLGDPRLRIFDCRFDLARPDSGRERYLDEHLPGAVYADLNRDLAAPATATSGRHPLPSPATFEARLQAWGVNAGSLVVAYDDGNGAYAARLWWMLRWLGHDAVQVLDGGMRRWLALGLPLDDAVPTPASGDFVARLRPECTADAATVLITAGDATARVLDVRAPERYRGEVEPIDAVAGHVPGARNHPFTASLDAQGRFLPPDELRRQLSASLDGVPADRTIAMCGSGVTACHLLLALEHAGLGGARLYPGSWSEWSSDPARPVRTGESA
ncbi:MAG: Sulfurtransferase [Pseudomonadota bacterium]|nr:Sulfurtransferase [Pseudomonadota bacterium]